MDEDRNDGLLVQEYMQLQKTVEDFDGRSLTIKAWSVTFSAAGLGLAYQQGNPILLLIASFSAFAFWLIDWIWKIHQHGFYPRIATIEAHFAARAGGGSAAASPPPLQIAAAWHQSFDRADNRLPRRLLAFGFPGVALPHAVIFWAGLLLYVLHPPVAKAEGAAPGAAAAAKAASAPAHKHHAAAKSQ